MAPKELDAAHEDVGDAVGLAAFVDVACVEHVGDVSDATKATLTKATTLPSATATVPMIMGMVA